MENNAASPRDNTLNRLTGLGMFFQGLILHFLHHFKALGLRAFFFRNGLVNIRWHDSVFFWNGNSSMRIQSLQEFEKDLPDESNWA